MKRVYIFLIALFINLGLFSFVNAQIGNIFGYVYSASLGWISLSCENTKSCSDINYGVVKTDDGLLQGYGFSQNGEWINFNPNYGGVTLDDFGFTHGWAFSEKSGWINLDDSKITFINNVKNNVLFVQNIIEYKDFSVDKIRGAVKDLCLNFLNYNECDKIN